MMPRSRNFNSRLVPVKAEIVSYQTIKHYHSPCSLDIDRLSYYIIHGLLCFRYCVVEIAWIRDGRNHFPYVNRSEKRPSHYCR